MSHSGLSLRQTIFRRSHTGHAKNTERRRERAATMCSEWEYTTQFFPRFKINKKERKEKLSFSPTTFLRGEKFITKARAQSVLSCRWNRTFSFHISRALKWEYGDGWQMLSLRSIIEWWNRSRLDRSLHESGAGDCGRRFYAQLRQLCDAGLWEGSNRYRLAEVGLVPWDVQKQWVNGDLHFLY